MTNLNSDTLDSTQTLDRQIARARDLYLKGQTDAAVDLLLGLGAAEPQDRRPYHALARIMMDAGKFKEARAALRTMPEPLRDRDWQILCGYCLGGLGETEAAETLAGSLAEANPESARILNLQGMLAAGQGDLALAEALFQQAFAVDAGYGDPCTNLGTLYYEAGHTGTGLDLLEGGFRLSPADTAAVTHYHAAVVQCEAFQRAETVFAEALADCPVSERVHCLYIDILLQQKKMGAALGAVESAMAVLGVADGMLDAALHIRHTLSRSPRPAAPADRPRVSLCMIVKDEQAHLARCLAGVKPVVDEIVVVDTGSSDRTVDLARALGAQVLQTGWQQDFARARNLSIEKATGDWILVMDADETLAEIDHAPLRDLIDTTPPGSAAFSITTRNYMHRMNATGWQPNGDRYPKESAGSGWFPSAKVRLFPNRPAVRFCFPVHEVVEPSLAEANIPVRRCPVPVHHYGKLDTRKNTAKGKAYFRIGLEKLREMADDPRALKELAVQAMNLERFAEAIPLWRRLVDMAPDHAEHRLNLGSAHWQMGDYGRAQACAEAAAALSPGLKEARFNLANSLLYLGQAHDAVQTLESLTETHPDYLAARFLMAGAYGCAGRCPEGAAVLETLSGTVLGPGLALSCITLAQGLETAGRNDYAQKVRATAAASGIDTRAAETLLRAGEMPPVNPACAPGRGMPPFDPPSP
jgi:tetratricopeptide (TPR) repeat protein